MRILQMLAAAIAVCIPASLAMGQTPQPLASYYPPHPQTAAPPLAAPATPPPPVYISPPPLPPAVLMTPGQQAAPMYAPPAGTMIPMTSPQQPAPAPMYAPPMQIMTPVMSAQAPPPTPLPMPMPMPVPPSVAPPRTPMPVSPSVAAPPPMGPMNVPPGTVLSTPMTMGEWMGMSSGPSQQLLTQGGQGLEQAMPGGGAGGENGGEQQDNGTNPAQNTRPTFIARNEYYSLDGGNQINTTFATLKYPILKKRGSFLMEVPYTFYDLVIPARAQIGGLNDIKFQMNYNWWTSASKKLTMIGFMELFIPSADNTLLVSVPNPNEAIGVSIGTGKYVLGPGLGFVYAIAPNFIFAPLYFYEFSVAGIDARPDIKRGKFRIFAMYALPSGLYTLPELQIITNYFNGRTDKYFAPEVGYSTAGSTFYIKPGIGIAPDQNDRRWGIEIGARLMY